MWLPQIKIYPQMPDAHYIISHLKTSDLNHYNQISLSW